MIDIKLSATFMVKSHKNFAQLSNCKDADGKVVYNKLTHDLNKLELKGKDKHGRPVTNAVYYVTPKSQETSQVMNISREAYMYFISNEVPEGFSIGPDFKVRQLIQAWKNTPKDEKIKWHLRRIADDIGGRLLSYQILED